VSISRPKDDVMIVQLSRHHSLDLVRLSQSRKYRVVFAERWGVQRRAFVEVSFEDALTIAKFLANIEDGMHLQDPNDETTDPGRPETMPPVELRQMVDNGDAKDRGEAVPEAIDEDPTGETRPTRAPENH
jgi:hypothetical protein